MPCYGFPQPEKRFFSQDISRLDKGESRGWVTEGPRAVWTAQPMSGQRGCTVRPHLKGRCLLPGLTRS